MGLQKEIVFRHKKAVFLHRVNQASHNPMVINLVLLIIVSSSGNFNYPHERSSPNIELLLQMGTILNTNLFSIMRVRILGQTQIISPFMKTIEPVIGEMDKILTKIITIPIDKLKGLQIKTIVKIHKILFPIISAQIGGTRHQNRNNRKYPRRDKNSYTRVYDDKFIDTTTTFDGTDTVVTTYTSGNICKNPKCEYVQVHLPRLCPHKNQNL